MSKFNRAQKQRVQRAKRLQRERMSYLNKGMPENKGFSKQGDGSPIPWMQGVKDVFHSHTTPKLACSHVSGNHQWVLSRGKMFHRCSSCRISTYHHPEKVAERTLTPQQLSDFKQQSVAAA